MPNAEFTEEIGKAAEELYELFAGSPVLNSRGGGVQGPKAKAKL
jgi:carnitine O-acetyltransferase